MRARRRSGLITGLLMLHLTFVSADFTRAEYGDHPQAHRNVMGHHEHRVAAAHLEAETAPARQPCETPTQPECCHAMTSCAVSATLPPGAGLESVPRVREVIEPAVMRAPVSQITSPDPPPPKV